jgi:hypothetical protein
MMVPSGQLSPYIGSMTAWFVGSESSPRTLWTTAMFPSCDCVIFSKIDEPKRTAALTGEETM